MKVAKCIFINNLKSYKSMDEVPDGYKVYCFKMRSDEQVFAGATAVVWTKNNLQIVKVVEISEDPEDLKLATQHIVSYVSIEDERQYQFDLVNKQVLLKQIAERTKQVEAEQALESLKELGDTKLTALVTQLREITKRLNNDL